MGVKLAVHEPRKTFGLGCQVAPNIGVVVQGIGHADLLAQYFAQPVRCCVWNGWHLQPARLRQVRDQGGLATRTAGRDQALTRQRAVDMKKLTRLYQTRRVFDPRYATARKERVIQSVWSGQRAGVAHRGLRT